MTAIRLLPSLPDEARKEYRELHGMYVELQAERQALLEQVANLERHTAEQILLEVGC